MATEAPVRTCFVVAGRVQGVFFRASTRAEAERLGLSGHARNLPDGRVEVLAQGSAEAVAALGHWLRQGPPQARVSAVDRVELDSDADADADAFPPEPGFRILGT